MNIRTFDDEAFAVDAEAHFYLWCCDCNLRHLVVVEAIGKGADEFKEKWSEAANSKEVRKFLLDKHELDHPEWFRLSGQLRDDYINYYHEDQ